MSEEAYYADHRLQYGCYPDEDQGPVEEPEYSPDVESADEQTEAK